MIGVNLAPMHFNEALSISYPDTAHIAIYSSGNIATFFVAFTILQLIDSVRLHKNEKENNNRKVTRQAFSDKVTTFIIKLTRNFELYTDSLR